jgi:uncharacterized protein YwqG
MRWPFRSRGNAQADSKEGEPAGITRTAESEMSDAEVVETIAAAQLPNPIRQRWLSLLRPAVLLVPGTNEAEHVARLGGQPDLPTDEPWPIWPGHGPLSYIGELHCDRLAGFPLDPAIPTSGRLMFFYFDGSYDNGVSTVGTWDAATLQGARALYVPRDVMCSQRPPPDGVERYLERWYAGRSIVTAPGWEHPDLRQAFMEPSDDHRKFMEHPVNADAFVEALHERHSSPLHQIGGYADPVQGPVEYEVAQAALDNNVPYDDPRLEDEALRWELLLQVDTDDDLAMMWGDCGVLYWMARPEDLAVNDLSGISFTWQCS